MAAAEAAERGAKKQIARITWTPGQRSAAIAGCRRALELLDRAQRHDVAFVFSPYSPLSPPGQRRGWRFLGRVLAWQIEDALAGGRYSQAVTLFFKAARFGADLSGGDALDASLGYAVLDEAARPLWNAFPELPAGELARVYAGLVRMLDRTPSLEATLRHERQTMLRAVQMIQDAFLEDDMKAVRRALGSSVDRAIRHLQSLRSKPSDEQVRYFEGFAAEGEAEIRTLLEQAAISPHLWSEPAEPVGERPWRRFANHYFQTGRFLMRWWARNRAKARLMAVDAALLSRFRRGRGLPESLSGLPKWVRTDPYSGRDFVFVPLGADYKLYSYGEDRKDDGGERGQPGAEPDLVVGR